MKEKIKIGYVGVGRRGHAVLDQCFSEMGDVEIVALCDSSVDALERAKETLLKKGRKEPQLTSNYDDILNNPEIDAVILMIGWQGRADMAIKSMYAGKYTAIEVGCAFDISECYQLVDAYEKTGVPLMMLENCCYGRKEMMALNVAEQGLFGEIAHCDGGYCHYLPDDELLKDIDGEKTHYRIQSYIRRNCETYPTHEFGPISKILKINRGNRMLTLNSVASKSVGLKEASKRILGEDSPYASIDYKQGDIVTTIIKCAGGETVRLTLDTTLPRAFYSRNFTIRGSKGMYAEDGKVLFFEGMEEPVRDNQDEMFKTYDHPLHKEYVEIGEKGGHGGMDWLVCRAFIESVKNGTDTPIDAYDTAAWMAIGPLSEASIAMGGAPVAVPDFTKGKWVYERPIVEGKYCLDKVCVDESVKI